MGLQVVLAALGYLRSRRPVRSNHRCGRADTVDRRYSRHHRPVLPGGEMSHGPAAGAGSAHRSARDGPRGRRPGGAGPRRRPRCGAARSPARQPTPQDDPGTVPPLTGVPERVCVVTDSRYVPLVRAQQPEVPGSDDDRVTYFMPSLTHRSRWNGLRARAPARSYRLGRVTWRGASGPGAPRRVPPPPRYPHLADAVRGVPVRGLGALLTVARRVRRSSGGHGHLHRPRAVVLADERRVTYLTTLFRDGQISHRDCG